MLSDPKPNCITNVTLSASVGTHKHLKTFDELNIYLFEGFKIPTLNSFNISSTHVKIRTSNPYKI